MEGRISELENIIKTATVVDRKTGDKIGISSVVRLKSGDNIIEYRVDYGNGTSNVTSDPDEALELTAVYTVPGYYDVTFSVTDLFGCVNAVTVDSLIYLQGPYASFSWETLNDCPPLEVEFTIDSSENVSSLLWFFGDGFTDTIFNPIHTYLEADTYYPFLWVEGNIEDPDGEIQSCIIPYSGDSIVIDGPVLAFELQNDTLCQDVDELVVINQSTNAVGFQVTKWECNYGDGVDRLGVAGARLRPGLVFSAGRE